MSKGPISESILFFIILARMATLLALVIIGDVFGMIGWLRHPLYQELVIGDKISIWQQFQTLL